MFKTVEWRRHHMVPVHWPRLSVHVCQKEVFCPVDTGTQTSVAALWWIWTESFPLVSIPDKIVFLKESCVSLKTRAFQLPEPMCRLLKHPNTLACDGEADDRMVIPVCQSALAYNTVRLPESVWIRNTENLILLAVTDQHWKFPRWTTLRNVNLVQFTRFMPNMCNGLVLLCVWKSPVSFPGMWRWKC